jgi:putative peptidoglycan lipid II flippase
LRRADLYRPEPGWAGFLAKLAVALAVMSVVLWWAAGPLEWWLHAGGAQRGLRLAVAVAAGAASYFLALLLLGFRPAQFARRVSV